MPSRSPSDADDAPRSRGRFPYGGVAVTVGVLEVLVIVVCLAVVYVALDSSGGWFTPTTYGARRTVWINTSIVALATIAAVSAYDVVYAVKRQRAGILLIQLAILAAELGIVLWGHSLIPVPPGVNSSL